MPQQSDWQEHYEIVQTQPRDANRAERLHLLPGKCKDQDQLAEWTGPFYFVQAADTQLGRMDRYKKVDPVDWKEEARLCELLVEKCNRMQPKPKFLVICGDLTDADPSAEMRQQQVRDFKRIFAKLDPEIPLVCLGGNRDFGYEPTTELVANYKRDFGDDFFYFVHGGVLFIVINSQLYEHREFVRDYATQQDEWLIEILKKCENFNHSFVFQHTPWFLERPDEANQHVTIDKPVRSEWLARFHEAGVTKIMCGHCHRNAGGWLDSMEQVVTSAVGEQLGPDKSGARLVKVLEGLIEHSYYALDDLPERIEGLC